MRDESEDRARSGRRGRRAARWLLGIVGGVVAAVLLAYGAAAVLIRVLVDPAALSNWAEPRAEAALNRDVEMDEVRLRIFPSLGAELRGVEVANPPELEGPPLARVEGVRLDVAILPLFRRRVEVDEVRIEAPTVHLLEAPDGRTNYGDLVPESTEPSDEGDRPVELAVRDVSLQNGHLTRLRLADSARTVVSGIRARASVSRRAEEGWSGSIEASADSVRVHRAAAPDEPIRLAGPAVRARTTAAEDFGWVEIRDGTLRLGEASLTLEGRLDGLQDSVRQVDLSLRADALELEGLLALLPEESRTRVSGVGGTATVDLRVHGAVGPERHPDVEGTVDLASVALAGPGGEPVAEGVTGHLQVRTEEVTVRELGGRLFDGPFTLEGSVVPDSAASFQMRMVADPRLGAAAALASLPEGAEVSGRLTARVEASGSARRPADVRLEGGIELADLSARHPALGVPVRIDGARVDLLGDRAEWSDLTVRLGDDEVRTTGTLRRPLVLLDAGSEEVPRLDAEVEGSRLDLDRLRVERENPEVTYARIAFAHLGETELEGRSAGEWAERRELALPDSLPASGELRVRLDTVISAPYRLSDVDARVVFGPALVEVPEADFGLYRGRGSGTVRMGVGGAPEPFALRLRVEGAEAEGFLSATSPLGPYVTGTLSLDLDVAGQMDERMLPVPASLGGEGRLRVVEGGVEENPLTRALADALSVSALAAPSFREWSAPFRIDGATLRFDDASFETPLGPLRYGGAVGFGGALDLGVRVALPAERLDSLALGRSGLLSAVAGRLTGGDGPVAVGLGLRGSVHDPEVRARASLATEDVRRSLEAEAEERAERLRDTARQRLEAERGRVEERARDELEERARDFLRGLGGRDRPSDTASDSVPEAADSVPDTTGSGTGARSDPEG